MHARHSQARTTMAGSDSGAHEVQQGLQQIPEGAHPPHTPQFYSNGEMPPQSDQEDAASTSHVVTLSPGWVLKMAPQAGIEMCFAPNQNTSRIQNYTSLSPIPFMIGCQAADGGDYISAAPRPSRASVRHNIAPITPLL